MNAEWIVGIDPGFTGGLALLHVTDHRAALLRTPTVTVKRGKQTRTEYDARAMWSILVAWRLRGIRYAVLEKASTRPGQHAAAVLHTGYGVGLWYGLVTAAGFGVQWTYPHVWKKHFGLLKQDKRASRLLVQERWPLLGAIGPSLEGPAEGLLMAEYIRCKEGFNHGIHGNGAEPGAAGI